MYVLLFVSLPCSVFPLSESYSNLFLAHLLHTFGVCRHFLGVNLSTLNSTMSRHLQAVLRAETPQNQRDWKEEGLFDLCYRLLFKYGEAAPLNSLLTTSLCL